MPHSPLDGIAAAMPEEGVDMRLEDTKEANNSYNTFVCYHSFVNAGPGDGGRGRKREC